MLQIGLNSQIMASKSSLNAEIGQRLAEMRRAIRAAYQLKLLVDQFNDDQLKTLGFTDGTGGTDPEIGYGVRTPLLACEDLYKIMTNTAPTAAQPHDYDFELRYVVGAQG